MCVISLTLYIQMYSNENPPPLCCRHRRQGYVIQHQGETLSSYRRRMKHVTSEYLSAAKNIQTPHCSYQNCLMFYTLYGKKILPSGQVFLLSPVPQKGVFFSFTFSLIFSLISSFIFSLSFIFYFYFLRLYCLSVQCSIFIWCESSWRGKHFTIFHHVVCVPIHHHKTRLHCARFRI